MPDSYDLIEHVHPLSDRGCLLEGVNGIEKKKDPAIHLLDAARPRRPLTGRLRAILLAKSGTSRATSDDTTRSQYGIVFD